VAIETGTIIPPYRILTTVAPPKATEYERLKPLVPINGLGAGAQANQTPLNAKD